MITDINPFVYSRPVRPEEVVDRQDDIRRLLELAAGGHYVRLYAPRRFGKTSLLRLALHQAERDEGMIPVLVDLYGVLSLGDVTIRIERAYARLRGGVRRLVENILQTSGLGLSLGAHGISVRLQTQPRTDPLPALHALLDLPLRVAERGGYRALIAFDEFQDVLKVDDFDKLLRSHVQHHGDAASYVFCGSEPGMMRELFDVKGRPLYGQAEPLRVGRLADADVAAYVVERFGATGRSPGEVLPALLSAARGHPQRAMLLAHRLWEEVEQGAVAEEEAWLHALAATKAQVQPEFEALWKGLGATEQRTLRAFALFPDAPYSRPALAAVGLKKSSAHYAVRGLVERAELEREDGRAVFVDPLLEAWLREGRAGPADPEEEE